MSSLLFFQTIIFFQFNVCKLFMEIFSAKFSPSNLYQKRLSFCCIGSSDMDIIAHFFKFFSSHIVFFPPFITFFIHFSLNIIKIQSNQIRLFPVRFLPLPMFAVQISAQGAWVDVIILHPYLYAFKISAKNTNFFCLNKK